MTVKRFHFLLVGLLLLAGLPLLAAGPGKDDKVTCRIIYVPTEEEVVVKMLDMASVNKDMTDILRSINRMVDLANAEKAKKKIAPLSFKDAFAGKLDGLSTAQQKELEDAVAQVNKVIDKINTEKTKAA